MKDDILESVSQGSDGAQTSENCRIAEISNELQRLCAVYEAQSPIGPADANRFEVEQRAAEALAKAQGFWIPLTNVFELGVPGPSGNENDTFVDKQFVYKVNNLLNSGSVVALLQKILLHNIIFPDTAYTFYGFTGMEGRTIQPIFTQARIENGHPATQIMIDTYMAALGFEKTTMIGRYRNSLYEVWDLLPRNVLVDDDGDVFVVDAEIRKAE